MEIGTGGLLAVCGGGGNDAVALIVLLAVVVAWFAALLVPLANAEDGSEGLILVGLSVGSVVIGGLIFLYPNGISGNDDYLLRFFLSLPVTAAIGIGVALATRRVSVGRALFVTLVGDLFVPGFLIVALFSSLAIGSGCLE